MDVLLVAAKKDMINDYTTVVSEAGLLPVVVDVDAFAVQNCFTANYDVPQNETVVLINAGAAVVNINIISGGHHHLHPRRHHRRQPVHRGDSEAAQRLLRRGRGAQGRRRPRRRRTPWCRRTWSG